MTTTIRLGARLRAARKAAGFHTAKAFLKKHKFPASTLSQHESGSRIPDDEALQYYSKVFSVNLNWLKTGKGLPFKNFDVAKKEKIDEELINLTQSNLNQQLLVDILGRLLHAQACNIPDHKLKEIAKEAARTYKDITSLSPSEKMQIKLLKAAFTKHK